MRTWTKWAIALTAVVAAGGLTFAVPALAEETSPNPPACVRCPVRGTVAPLMRQLRAQVTAAVADLLGITVDELNDAWAEGRTAADLAEEKGVSLEEIRAVAKTQVQSFLDQAVADGTLTQEQADWLLRHYALRRGRCHPGRPGRMMDGEPGDMMWGGSWMRFPAGSYEG